jgi:hypothetical protein
MRAHQENDAEFVVEADRSPNPEFIEVVVVSDDRDLISAGRNGRSLSVGLDAHFAAACQQEHERAERGQSPHY